MTSAVDTTGTATLSVALTIAVILNLGASVTLQYVVGTVIHPTVKSPGTAVTGTQCTQMTVTIRRPALAGLVVARGYVMRGSVNT